MKTNYPDKSSAADVRRRLEAMAEAKLADFSSALIPGLSRPILGVRVPRLRQLAKELAAGDGEALLDGGLPDETFEEVMLHGLVTGYARMPWPEKLARIESFVPRIDNWAVCDCCCSTFTAVRKHRAETLPLLQSCAASRSEYRQRFAAVMLMDHFLCDEYAATVLRELSAIRPAGYYAAMGVGWALSVCFVKYPEKTLAVLENPAVPAQSRALACRKILESRRTAEPWRTVIKEMKKKIAST